MSEEINKQNDIRKGLDQQITNEALQMLTDDPDNENNKSTVVCGENWHKGVVGIVASRLIDSFYRPTIVLSLTDGMISGSARSVGGFDIYSAIDSCNDLLTNFGGHIYAAGLSMKPENLSAFKERFEKYVSEHILPEQMQPVIEVETEISFADITAQFFNILRHLEPFGPGNPRPVFVTRNVCNYRYTRRVGKQNEHLRLDVTDRTGSLQGIAFGKGDFALPLMNGENMDICYELQQNTFNGQTNIQMMVQDIKRKQNGL
jgi:single-stranded-DNA-specific exonuclease